MTVTMTLPLHTRLRLALTATVDWVRILRQHPDTWQTIIVGCCGEVRSYLKRR